MKHKFVQKDQSRLMILFHGTGGDENSMIGFAEAIDNEASLLALRGNINENGLNRFFRRLSVGVFDFENLKHETDIVFDFLNDFVVKNNFTKASIIMLGYSNGANMIGSLLFNKNHFFTAAILLRPMPMVKEPVNVNLNKLPVFMSSGKYDQLVSLSETIKLKDLLVQSKAVLTANTYDCGHELVYNELTDIKLWYQKIININSL